ncbi:hypothetical protein ONE63_011578 [Megalurothrips usitatus]|uniref:CCHC-type domain-containing protein n=1 Tax=Megalurothrips usitatus TaxID=439358 RepID=A0AAV7WYX5_9NEOP|nr:hypothetical protein ONE63_011578 [Megalurothrips usitatus]
MSKSGHGRGKGGKAHRKESPGHIFSFVLDPTLDAKHAKTIMLSIAGGRKQVIYGSHSFVMIVDREDKDRRDLELKSYTGVISRSTEYSPIYEPQPPLATVEVSYPPWYVSFMGEKFITKDWLVNGATDAKYRKDGSQFKITAPCDIIASKVALGVKNGTLGLSAALEWFTKDPVAEAFLSKRLGDGTPTAIKNNVGTQTKTITVPAQRADAATQASAIMVDIKKTTGPGTPQRAGPPRSTPKTPTKQCYRCQRFGHTSVTCDQPEKCRSAAKQGARDQDPPPVGTKPGAPAWQPPTQGKVKPQRVSAPSSLC